MADKRKVEIVWGIRREGRLIPRLIRSRRHRAIREACLLVSLPDEPTEKWSTLRRGGFTVHKLEVRDAR